MLSKLNRIVIATILSLALLFAPLTSANADIAGILTTDQSSASIQTELESIIQTEINDNCYVLESDIRIANNGSEVVRDINLQVPLMAQINSPYQQVVGEEFSIQPTVISELENGNRIGTFAIEQMLPGSEIVLTQKYTIAVDGSNWLQTLNETEADLTDPEAYLAAESKIQSTDPAIQAIANQITSQAGKGNNQEIARQVFEFTHSTLTYSLSAPSVNQGALAALQSGVGSCVEYASLFVAISRAAGVPARIVNGFANDTAELAANGDPVNLQGRRHQWAEFYQEGQGWIPVDPTLTNSQNSMFGELPTGFYAAQNYGDAPIRGSYKGGSLAINLSDQITKNV